MALDFFAGCLGGCAGIVVGYPLDTVKVHMQTQDYRNPKYRGTWHCFRTILAKESVVGLYRGMSSPMAGVAVVNAIVFGVYGQTQRCLPESDRLSAHFLAGVSAGVAQTPVCSPIELAKTRLQLQSSSGGKYTGPMECLRHIYKSEGYRGVFNGLGITFMREAPSYGIYFLTYEALTRTTSNEPVSTMRMLMAGGLAGTASWVLTYPVDFVKSRLQAESRSRYSGILDCLRQSVKAEGYSCLYRGLNSTILRAFPTNAATFAVVTWTFRLFGPKSNTVSEAPEILDAAGPVVVESKNRTYESFVRKWRDFFDAASNGKLFSGSDYSTVRLSGMNPLVFENLTGYPIVEPMKAMCKDDTIGLLGVNESCEAMNDNMLDEVKQDTQVNDIHPKDADLENVDDEEVEDYVVVEDSDDPHRTIVATKQDYT